MAIVSAVVEVFVAHFWSTVLWHSFMRFTILSAMFFTQVSAGDPWKCVSLFGVLAHFVRPGAFSGRSCSAAEAAECCRNYKRLEMRLRVPLQLVLFTARKGTAGKTCCWTRLISTWKTTWNQPLQLSLGHIFLIGRSRTFSLFVAGACWMFVIATPSKERGMSVMRGMWSLCLQPLSTG